MTATRIILGVTGGIAAYKTPELVRRLKDRGAEVQVVLTRGAREFVTETTLQAVSGLPVRENLWDKEAEAAMGHIELARWADQVLIAPATAEILSRLAAGSAPDLLTTLCLATEAPIAIAPAMNHVMWANPAVQDNRRTLEERGYRIIGPAVGDQACGETGPGRMVEPDDIVATLLGPAIVDDMPHPALDAKTVVITAGPTREAIDPVRYLTNRSSGKMGYALAAAFRAAGSKVLLVSGPVGIAAPAGVVLSHNPSRGPEARDTIPPKKAGHSRARDRGGAGGDLDEAAQRLHHEQRLVVRGGAVFVLREMNEVDRDFRVDDLGDGEDPFPPPITRAVWFGLGAYRAGLVEVGHLVAGLLLLLEVEALDHVAPQPLWPDIPKIW